MKNSFSSLFFPGQSWLCCLCLCLLELCLACKLRHWNNTCLRCAVRGKWSTSGWWGRTRNRWWCDLKWNYSYLFHWCNYIYSILLEGTDIWRKRGGKKIGFLCSEHSIGAWSWVFVRRSRKGDTLERMGSDPGLGDAALNKFDDLSDSMLWRCRCPPSAESFLKASAQRTRRTPRTCRAPSELLFVSSRILDRNGNGEISLLFLFICSAWRRSFSYRFTCGDVQF